MVTKEDVYTLPLPLIFTESAPADCEPTLFIGPPEAPAPEPARPYLSWRPWHGEEAWITRWNQDGLLFTAKIEVVELLNPEVKGADNHVWSHRIEVHAFNNESEEVATCTLDGIESPLYDFDIYPMLDDVVYEIADQCVAYAAGERQQALLH